MPNLLWLYQEPRRAREGGIPLGIPEHTKGYPQSLPKDPSRGRVDSPCFAPYMRTVLTYLPCNECWLLSSMGSQLDYRRNPKSPTKPTHVQVSSHGINPLWLMFQNCQNTQGFFCSPFSHSFSLSPLLPYPISLSLFLSLNKGRVSA